MTINTETNSSSPPDWNPGMTNLFVIERRCDSTQAPIEIQTNDDDARQLTWKLLNSMQATYVFKHWHLSKENFSDSNQKVELISQTTNPDHPAYITPGTCRCDICHADMDIAFDHHNVYTAGPVIPGGHCCHRCYCLYIVRARINNAHSTCSDLKDSTA